VRAPKPTLIISTTRDFFSIQGARETYQEAGKAYTALGAKGNLQMTEEDYVHGFTKKNREAMYAFFQKHLDHPGDATDHEVETIPVDELWVTETGQLATSLQGETIYSLNKKVVEKQMARLESARTNIDEHLSKVPDAAIKFTGFSFPEKFGPEIFSGRFVHEEYKLEKYLIPGSGQYMLPLALFIPNKNSKREAILLLHEKGKDYAVNNDSLAKQLVADGYTVLLGDLPGIGELGPGYLKGDAYIEDVSYNQWFAGILTGKSIVGLRAEDITRMGHFLKSKFSEFNAISAVSVGVLGSELLHAALLDRSIQKVCLVRPFLSFAGIALEPDYKPASVFSTVAGAIERYDLPDLMAALSPRKVMILNPLSATGEPAGNEKKMSQLTYPGMVFKHRGVEENFRVAVVDNGLPVDEKVLMWLK
ncbi:MAG: hypothetical protein ABFS38_15140, partial [Bacteroidota bacterium]